MDSLQKDIQLCENAMIHPEMPLLYDVKAGIATIADLVDLATLKTWSTRELWSF